MSLYVIGGIVLVCLVLAGIIFSKLYVRASKKMAFVKTGLGGEKVIKDGGATVLPIFHEIVPVNMETLKIEISKEATEALITKDKQLIDIKADFFVKVKPEAESISRAARTLGDKLTNDAQLKDFIESKFVDGLRSVAATMEMENLHIERNKFVQEVQATVIADLDENGLSLESVSLVSLDQTNTQYYKEGNVFNAEGLTKTTMIIQSKREQNNKVLKETEVTIAKKNMEAEKERLEIEKDATYNKLEQEREIAVRKASQESLIKSEQAVKFQEAEDISIKAQQETEIRRSQAAQATMEAHIAKEKAVEKANIEKSRELEQVMIEKDKATQEAVINSKKAVETAELQKAIEIAEKQKAESEAKAEAERARKELVKEEEDVKTVIEVAKAEREKEIEIIDATKDAETKSIEVKISARATREAEEDLAKATMIKAKARAEQVTVEAKARTDASLLEVKVSEKQYTAEAEGIAAKNDAENSLSPEQIQLKMRLALIEQLPAIIAASVKPMEAINEIKIMQVEGLSRGGSIQVDGEDQPALTGKKNMFEQAKDAALGYQVEKPLVEKLLKEVGLGGDLSNILSGLDLESNKE
jgi:uncharacterized membrane protein YqiK